MIHMPTVWVVDDDADDLYLIQTAFSQIVPPIAIKQLTDGEQLLPSLREASELPRLVLLDLNMQRMNGFEALKELRTIPAFGGVPVVILTTSEREADKQQSMTLGANGFLTKPPSQQGIVKMLRQLTVD